MGFSDYKEFVVSKEIKIDRSKGAFWTSYAKKKKHKKGKYP